jgi:hypothetical protein
MSFYPMTVNYWTMRESSSLMEGKRNLSRNGYSFFVNETRTDCFLFNVLEKTILSGFYFYHIKSNEQGMET